MKTDNRSCPAIFAHRGNCSLCPENTMEAFEKAVEVGARGIELDVHISRDGRLVVCHDETVNRTTGGKGYIKDLDYEDIRKLDAGSWFSRDFAGVRVPLLDDVLFLLRDKLNVWFAGERFDEAAARGVLASGVDRVITNFPNLYLNLARG